MTTQATPVSLTARVINATTIITSLGYFVDMFDFFLYNMLRMPSLAELGLSGADLTSAGLLISNFQMAGLLLGAITWGVLGDKFGRKSSLFASIIIYSLATLGCAFVTDIGVYGWLRFAAGFGIAGELGAGVTLVAERLAAKQRGWGMTLFITTGFAGVLAAMLVVEYVPWRTAYITGGIGGLVLLALRTLIMESGLYQTSLNDQGISRGRISLLWQDRQRLKKFIAGIFIVAPGVFAPQILWTLSPEIAKSYGITVPVKANIVIGIGFFCSMLADLLSIWISEKLSSRKRSVAIMHGLAVGGFAAYLLVPRIFEPSYAVFITLSGLMGLTMGVWVMGIVATAEQFGTNMRATMATTVPNFARALTIPMNLAFAQLKIIDPVFAVMIIGCCILALSYWGRRQIEETYGKDLNYVEQ